VFLCLRLKEEIRKKRDKERTKEKRKKRKKVRKERNKERKKKERYIRTGSSYFNKHMLLYIIKLCVTNCSPITVQIINIKHTFREER
jgi:hypothetical protein